MDNVIIDIGANTKEFLAGLTEVGDKTSSMEDKLKGVGVAAGLAFAGYTAAIMGTVYAYREEEKIGQEINAILRATGGIAGVTAHAIDELAESLSKSTTFSREQVARGEEILLTFTQIGKDVFPAATRATLDLAQRMGGDSAAAAQVLGRALQDPMQGLDKLRKAGIFFTEQQKDQITQMELSGNMAGAQAVVLKQLESQFGGMAQAAAGGTGQLVVLKNTMQDLAQGVGKQFAPFVEEGARQLNGLLRAAGESDTFKGLIAGVLGAGAAVSGLISTAAAGAVSLTQLAKAGEVAKLVINAMGLSVKTAVGATGIGLLLIVVAEIYMHWNVVWPAMQATFKAFVDHIGQAAQGLGKILLGAFTLDIGLIKEGIAQAAKAFADGFKEVKAALPKATPEMITEAQKAGRDIATAQARSQQQALMAEQATTRRLEYAGMQAEQQAKILELQGHTKKVVALKREEATTLQSLSKSHNAAERAALRAHLSEIQAEYKKEEQNEQKQIQSFGKLKASQHLKLSTAERAALVASVKTREDVRHEAAVKELNDEIAADNTFLAEQERFGTAYATINKFMHSKVIEGSSKAFTEMAQMQQSSNSFLKGIGQTAAAFQIAIKTVESAQNIYAGFSTIPIIGQALGIAGAASAMLFGAENERKVLGMDQGGQIPWNMGIPGKDSVPLLGKPGEIYGPPESFAQTMQNMAGQIARSNRSGSQSGKSDPINVKVTVELKGNASRMLQVQAVQDKSMGIYRGT